MVATPSTMLQLGTDLPKFSLLDVVSGQTVTRNDVDGSGAVLVMFICNHCPYVQHIMEELDRLAGDYIPRGISILAINSNDTNAYPQDGPGPMKELAEKRGWTFRYLFDETQQAAKIFQAACTPDFFLFDGQRRLVYRGQLDDSRPQSGIPLTGRDLRAAMEAVLAGQPVPGNQKPSLGCNIKWKPGNEPSYFV